MNSDDKLLTSAIRAWLADHPLSETVELDIHGVPPLLFDLAVTDERLKQLNHQIKGLPLPQQKLLKYLSQDMDPALIIESMEYASPELFWLDKALLVKEVDPTARQQDVLQVFSVNESLLTEIFTVSDLMDQEKEKSKNRKFRKWSLVAAPVVLLLFYFFILPLIVRPDPVALYEKFKSAYHVEMNSIDTTSYNGGAFYEALLLMEDGRFPESAKLFEEIIPADTSLQIRARWFLGLIYLRNGDSDACNGQLKAIRSNDPRFFGKVAVNLYRKINR